MKLLEINHVEKSFDDLNVLKDISLSVEDGEIVSIIGPSGSGKSTLLRCATMLETMDSGEIVYLGKKAVWSDENGKLNYADKKDLKEIQSQYGLVFQNFNLFPHFSVLKNITDAPIHVQKRDKEEVYKEARELLKKMGLEDKENAYPCQLSGGQCQRVAIARALALNPEFIVCDEPISALDVSIQAQVVNMLMKFQEEMDLTYLFIAHDLSMVRHIADQTAVMYLGTMVEYGSTRDVYEHPVHPYTRGLLSAVPVADPDYEKAHNRIPMDGEVPSPINPKPGCRFCARCRKATAQCHEETPKLRDVGGGHMAACWNL